MKNIVLIGCALFLQFQSFSQKKENQPAPAAAAPATSQAPAAEIKWVSINDLPALLQKERRKVIVDVYTTWCGPCRMMMNTTFKDPGIVNYINNNFYAVKFNAEGSETVTFKGYEFKNPQFDPARANGRNGTHDLTLAIAPVQGRIAYPTLVYFDEDLNILAPLQGYYQAPQLQPVLTYFKENKHKEIDLNTYMNQTLGNPSK